MRKYKTEQINYNYKKAARFLLYGILAVFGIAVLTCILNVVFLISAAVVYVNTDSSYIGAERTMDALTLTQSGYTLGGEMEKEFEQSSSGRCFWMKTGG